MHVRGYKTRDDDTAGQVGLFFMAMGFLESSGFADGGDAALGY